MENRSITPFTKITAAICALLTASTGFALSGDEAEAHFALKVLPVMQQKCFACHGDDEEEIKFSTSSGA